MTSSPKTVAGLPTVGEYVYVEPVMEEETKSEAESANAEVFEITPADKPFIAVTSAVVVLSADKLSYFCGKRVGCERSCRDNGYLIRGNVRHFFFDYFNVRAASDFFGNIFREDISVNRESAACRYS